MNKNNNKNKNNKITIFGYHNICYHGKCYLTIVILSIKNDIFISYFHDNQYLHNILHNLSVKILI
mgnify:CR=1 FL=1